MPRKILKPENYMIGAATKRLDSHTPEIALKMKHLSAVLMKKNKKLYESLATK